MAQPSDTQVPKAHKPQSVVRVLQDFGRCAVDFLYPRHCAVCQTALPESLTCRAEICDGCRRDLLSNADAACDRCGAPIGPYVDPAGGCNFCVRQKFAFERVIRLGIYEDQLRQACLGAKGGRQQALAAALAELQWERREEAFRDTPIDVVVPVPHFWLQRLSRLHNPAETLAGVWAHNLKVRKSNHILVKAKWTKPQRSLPADRRRENVRKAFKVGRPEEIQGATVLLVDDIMTTGATAHEAARVLKQVGAGRVITAVVARAMRN